MTMTPSIDMSIGSPLVDGGSLAIGDAPIVTVDAPKAEQLDQSVVMAFENAMAKPLEDNRVLGDALQSLVDDFCAEDGGAIANGTEAVRQDMAADGEIAGGPRSVAADPVDVAVDSEIAADEGAQAGRAGAPRPPQANGASASGTEAVRQDMAADGEIAADELAQAGRAGAPRPPQANGTEAVRQDMAANSEIAGGPRSVAADPVDVDGARGARALPVDVAVDGEIAADEGAQAGRAGAPRPPQARGAGANGTEAVRQDMAANSEIAGGPRSVAADPVDVDGARGARALPGDMAADVDGVRALPGDMAADEDDGESLVVNNNVIIDVSSQINAAAVSNGNVGQVESVSAVTRTVSPAAQIEELTIAINDVADQVLVTPSLHTENVGEVMVQLKPDVLYGSQVKIAFDGKSMEVTFMPSQTSVADLLVNNQQFMQQQLVNRIDGFEIAVRIAQTVATNVAAATPVSSRGSTRRMNERG